MIENLAHDLRQSREAIITEMAKTGVSITANQIVKQHGYQPRGNMLYTPRKDNPITYEFWHASFLGGYPNRELPYGYKKATVTMQTLDGNKFEFAVIYRNTEIAALDPEGHFGVFSHTQDMEGLRELADFYGIRPDPFRIFIESLNLEGI